MINNTICKFIATLLALTSIQAHAALINIYDTDRGGHQLDSVADAWEVVDSSNGPDVSVESNRLNFANPGIFGRRFPGNVGAKFVMTVEGSIDLDEYKRIKFKHDDGFALAIAGIEVARFDGNTAPRYTTIDFRNLGLSGLVSFDLIYWDQGGIAVAKLFDKKTHRYVNLGNPLAAAIPEPMSAALLMAGLAGLVLAKRRRV